MINKYRVHCLTDDKYEYTLSDVAPTVCPIDSNHSIKATSISIEEHDVKTLDGGAHNMPLSEHKRIKKILIDKKTDELIPLGFTYDGATFKCRLEDRVNYGHIEQFRAIATFPMNLITVDDTYYSLTEVNLDAFILAAMTHINTVTSTGGYYKSLVMAATTGAEIDAIVDNR